VVLIEIKLHFHFMSTTGISAISVAAKSTHEILWYI